MLLAPLRDRAQVDLPATGLAIGGHRRGGNRRFLQGLTGQESANWQSAKLAIIQC
jgi:hypothetical protein